MRPVFSCGLVVPHSIPRSRVSCEHVYRGMLGAVHPCTVLQRVRSSVEKVHVAGHLGDLSAGSYPLLGSRLSLHPGALWVLPRSSHWLV